MPTFAADTDVPVEKSKAEIERMLMRYGAAQYVCGTDNEQHQALVGFSIAKRQFRLAIPLPLPIFPKKGQEPPGWSTWTPERRARWSEKRTDQATRTRWRAVHLLVKAKLEAVSIGLSTVEREFLADLVLTDGGTLHRRLSGEIASSYDTGRPPMLMLGPGPTVVVEKSE